MIIAHLPSGYLLGRSLPKAPLLLPAALVGSVFPDISLIWYYFIDDRAYHTQEYWVHIPMFWLMVAVVTLPLVSRFARKYLPAAITFFLGTLLHCCLDTFDGYIMWLWPFTDKAFTIFPFEITRHWGNWILNSIFRWIFLVEVIICCVALIAWLRRNRHKSSPENSSGTK